MPRAAPNHLRSASRLLSSVLKKFQVQYHGQYSFARIHALSTYSRDTSLCRAVLVLLLSPLPSLIVCVLVDTIPLSSPSSGLGENRAFVSRLFVSMWVFAFLGMEDIRSRVGSLVYSKTRLVMSSALVALGSTGAYCLLGRCIGFPLPYSMVMIAPVAWIPLIFASFAIVWGRAAWKDLHCRREILSVVRIWGCQVTLLVIYPLYVLVFLHTPASARLTVMLAIPMVKITLRAGFSKGLSHLRDAAPVVVTLSADVFSSLFITYAMQTTTLTDTMGLIALDVIYMLKCQWDMERQVQEINTIRFCLDAERRHKSGSRTHAEARRYLSAVSPTTSISVLSMIERAKELASRQPDIMKKPVSRSSTRRVGPLEKMVPAVIPIRQHESIALHGSTSAPKKQGGVLSSRQLQQQVTPLERQFVLSVSRFLYTMEYVLLRNFIEACIPLIYGACFALMLHHETALTHTWVSSPPHSRRKLHDAELLSAQQQILRAARVDRR